MHRTHCTALRTQHRAAHSCKPTGRRDCGSQWPSDPLAQWSSGLVVQWTLPLVLESLSHGRGHCLRGSGMGMDAE